MPGRPPIYRPINPLDNPSTTGLTVNPNGTYIANSYPTTGSIGAIGAYGSALPTVQVAPLPYEVNPFSQAVKSLFSRPSGAYPGYSGEIPNIPTGNRPAYPLYAQGVQAIQAEQQRAAAAANYQPGFSAQSAVPGYVPSYQAGTGFNPAVNTKGQQARYQDIIARLAAGEQINLTKSDQEAIEKLLSQGAGGGGAAPGTGQFYGYERNPETGRSERVVKSTASSDFSKELRWDPERRKYVQIGKLMREGKLDKYGGWHRGRSRGRGGKRDSAPKKSGWTGSYGVVNFNVATG